MPNSRLVESDYVQTASFTLRAKDLKYLDKLAKKFKNRSEALRWVLDDAQDNARVLKAIESYPTGGNCPRRTK